MQLNAPLVGWFHLSADEKARARDFLRRCNTEDSVDELGLGIIRDGFSDEFYPGTSTVMTQPRYLIFAPAIYRFIEKSVETTARAVPDPMGRAREMQDQLRDVLAAKYGHRRGHGVIGILGGEIERYPSAIYWASMRTLGIFRRKASEDDYMRSLESHHESHRVDANHGDPVAEMQLAPPAWDRDFPYSETGSPIQDSRGRFADGIGFELPACEAVYLANCYLARGTRDKYNVPLDRSLLAELIARRRKAPFAYPWVVKPPPHLEQTIDDARHFSLFARGVVLHYYFLLLEERRRSRLDTPEADIPQQFAAWWEQGRPELLRWEEGEFLLRRVRDVRASRHDASFIQGWLSLCRQATSPSAFLRRGDAKDLIVRRELACKPRKARLTHRKYLESWNRQLSGGDSPFELDYRTRIGETFVHRIVEGLEETPR
jgi:hypothetical protein